MSHIAETLGQPAGVLVLNALPPECRYVLAINEGNTMKVKFVLVMDYVVAEIHGQKFMVDQLILEWESEMEQAEILAISHQWIHDEHFLTQRMVGLSRVRESSLTIEAFEPTTNER